MNLNWKKAKALPVRCGVVIPKLDGSHVGQAFLDLFGCPLTKNGSIAHELNRRLGMARVDVATLPRVWKHSPLSIQVAAMQPPLQGIDFEPTKEKVEGFSPFLNDSFADSTAVSPAPAVCRSLP